MSENDDDYNWDDSISGEPSLQNTIHNFNSSSHTDSSHNSTDNNYETVYPEPKISVRLYRDKIMNSDRNSSDFTSSTSHSSHSSHRSDHSSRSSSDNKCLENCDNGCPQVVKNIIVYLLTERPCNDRVRKLIKFFKSSAFFKLKVIDIPPPASLDVPDTMTANQALEAYRFNKVLTSASNKYPDKYILVIKDSAVTITTPQLLEETIQTALNLACWDVFYLTKWLDACNLYRDKVNVKCSNSMTTLVKTMSPNGTLALIFSPKGRDIVIGRCKMADKKYFTPIKIPLGTKLNENIIIKNINAICSVPNQFEYDLFEATHVSDLAKLSSCRRPGEVQPAAKPDNLPLFWFVIIVVAAFLVIWALYILGPSNKKVSSTYKVNVEDKK